MGSKEGWGRIFAFLFISLKKFYFVINSITYEFPSPNPSPKTL